MGRVTKHVCFHGMGSRQMHVHDLCESAVAAAPRVCCSRDRPMYWVPLSAQRVPRAHNLNKTSQVGQVQGTNPWHWADRPGMSPTDGFARGAVSLGEEVRQWYEWIGGNVSAAHQTSPSIGE